MRHIMVVGNEYLTVGAPVFLDIILLNIARKRKIGFFGTGQIANGEWRFTLGPVEKLQRFAFSRKHCITMRHLPDCIVIVNVEESEDLRWALQNAGHMVEVVLHDF